MRLSFKQIGLGAAAIGAAMNLGGCADEICDAALEAELIADLNANGCPSLAEGEASISGVPSLDGFFAAVLRFKGTATELSGGIDAELSGLQADFGLTDADVSAAGGLGAAIKADLSADIEGDLDIAIEPARCAVDAQASFSASADCQAKAGCEVEVEPGNVEFECMGSCEVEASASASCSGEAMLACDISGPEVACSGSCEGSCTAELDAGVECNGVCEGTCMGGCEGTEQGGSCDGTCTGECDGTCTFEARAGAECSGSCTGTCTARGPEANCEGAANVRCEAEASASVMCEGKCDGTFEPPMAMAMCEASASCNAEAEANASLDVVCTPPSIDIKYELKAGLDAKAKLEFQAKINALKARLPQLRASLKKGDIVLAAGADLRGAATAGVEGLVDFIKDSDKISAAGKIQAGVCAVDGFAEVGGQLSGATSDLEGSVSGALDVFGELSI